MYTERDFVRDLEYLRDTWIKRLRESDVVPAERKEVFIEQGKSPYSALTL